MAKYEVTFSCGHSDIVSLTGKHEDRERRIKWYETSGYCPQCKAKLRDYERAEANTEAAAKAKELNLPALEGTEKQVTWATTIRQQFIDRMEKNELTERDLAVYEYIIENVLKASSWIDMRYKFDKDIIELYRRDGVAHYIRKKMKMCEQKDISAILKEHRMKQGLSQQNLANLAGVHLNQIQKLEHREIKFEQMTAKNAVAISRALNLDINDLL